MKKYIILIIMISLFGCSTRSKIEKICENQKSVDEKEYHPNQIKNLPDPVKRYFKYALKNGQSYVRSLELEHGGTFKTSVNAEEIPIEGKQYFTTNPPSFVWVGKTKQFTAHDIYIDGKGNLSVYLFGLIRIVNKKGDYINQGELLRLVGESVWMPTNLLPNEYVSWSPIDENNSKLHINYNGINAFYNVEFNDSGQIISLQTERYMEEGRLEKWVGRVSEYKEVNGMMVPTKILALWDLEEGELIYAKFNIKKFTYNKLCEY